MRDRGVSPGLALLLTLAMLLPALACEGSHYQVVGQGDRFDWHMLYDASGHPKIPGDLEEAYADLREMLPESASRMFRSAYQYAVKNGHPDDEETWPLMWDSLSDQLKGETTTPGSVLLDLVNGLVRNWRLAGEGRLPFAFRRCGVGNKFDMATRILQGYGRSLSGTAQKPDKVCQAPQ